MWLSLIQHLTFLFALIFVFRSLLKCGPQPAQHLTDSASPSAGSSAVCTSFLSMHLLVWWCPPQLQQRRKCMLPTFTNSFYIINFLIKIPKSHFSSHTNFSLLYQYLFFILFSYVSFYVSTKSINASHNILFFFSFSSFSFHFSFLFLSTIILASESKPPHHYLWFSLVPFPILFLLSSSFFRNQKHLCPHLHIFNQNICVSQNNKVRRRENETTYLDPEAQTCPALVPVLMLSLLVTLW